MKLAFLVLAHKNPNQLDRLIAALDHQNSIVLVHIDNKMDIKQFEFIFNKNYKNVFLCKKRMSVNWGGFSMIEAAMNLIEMLISLNANPDYVTLLSGQDFPIKSNDEISLFFAENKGKNFIQNFKLPLVLSNDVGNGFERIQYWHWLDKHTPGKARKLRTIQKIILVKRSFPKGIDPYLGSQWWSLQLDCVKFIHQQYLEKNILFSFYKHAFVPDEMLFQTLIMNSYFKDSVVNDNMRFVNWNGAYVHNFTPKDWDRINSTNNLFARKFDISVDEEIIRYLEIKRDRIAYRKELEKKFITEELD